MLFPIIGIPLIVAFLGYILWSGQKVKRQNQKYVQSRILDAFQTPSGPVTRKYDDILKACVTEHVSEKEVHDELDRLVEDGRVDQHDLSDYNFVYSIPGTIKLRHVPLPPGSVV